MNEKSVLISKSALAVVKRTLDALCTHTTMTNLFEEHGFDVRPNAVFQNKLEKAGGYLDNADWSRPESVERLLCLLAGLFGQCKAKRWSFTDATTPWPQLVAALAREGIEWDGEAFVPATAAALVQSADLIEGFGIETVTSEVDRILSSVATDPGDAITSARALVESACRAILTENGAAADSDASLPGLVKQVTSFLELTPRGTESTRGAQAVDRMLKGIGMAVQSLAELRNEYGDAHGRDPQHVALEPRHARMAAGFAAAVALFIMESAGIG